jgi:phage N-6-adenine-methyltransferase
MRRIGLDKLDPHPHNPRVVLREALLDNLTEWIKRDGFHEEHALLVRPLAKRFQVVAGHHRLEASRRAGLAEVPCFVREMDDAEAMTRLVTSNEQSDMSPLEIGLHALHAVPKEAGGRGKKGGLREYAAAIGRAESGVRDSRKAAEVYTAIRADSESARTSAQYLDRTYHLAEVHAAPPALWPVLARHCLGWSVAETKAAVARVGQFTEDPVWGPCGYLPLAALVARHLENPAFTPVTADRLARQASRVRDAIPEITELDAAKVAEAQAAWQAWLVAEAGGKSWDEARTHAHGQQLLEDLRPPPTAVSAAPGYDGDEWYTPARYVEAARQVMGSIDLDPATCDHAQQTVRAAAYFTKEQDGLAQQWTGNVWINPPYSFPLIERFASKLLDEVMAGHVDQAVLLVNNCTDAGWFQALLKVAPVCFTAGRVSFEHPERPEKFATRQGQAFFYFGANRDRFVEVFSAHGTVVEVCR